MIAVGATIPTPSDVPAGAVAPGRPRAPFL